MDNEIKKTISDLILKEPFKDFLKGTEISSDYLKFIDYIWNNYSTTFSLIRSYNLIKNYELKYKKTSVELYKQWEDGSILSMNPIISDWLTTYLQIKDFIRE